MTRGNDHEKGRKVTFPSLSTHWVLLPFMKIEVKLVVVLWSNTLVTVARAPYAMSDLPTSQDCYGYNILLAVHKSIPAAWKVTNVSYRHRELMEKEQHLK